MELGERIKQARQKAHLSQEKVAELIGVSRQAVTKWESGQSAPNTENLFRLAEILGITVDQLIATEDNSRSIAEEVYRMIKDEEAKKEAQRKAQSGKNVLVFFCILGTYILIYLAGKFSSWDKENIPLFPWIITLVSTQHSYLFGWLLKSDLFHYSMIFSSLAALLGLRRLSLTTLAGFIVGMLLGESLGGHPQLVVPWYHYGWAIWGGIYLGSWAFGLWLQKMGDIALRDKKFLLWILSFLGMVGAVTVFVILAIPPYARA